MLLKTIEIKFISAFRAGLPLAHSPGVSILSKNQVFYKGGYESLEFFIRRHYVVFTKNKVVVYKKSAFFVRCVRFHDIQ